jgi:hypothetical protein
MGKAARRLGVVSTLTVASLIPINMVAAASLAAPPTVTTQTTTDTITFQQPILLCPATSVPRLKFAEDIV